MPAQPTVLTAQLGPHTAAFTCRVRGEPAAVINVAARDNPAMRAQAAIALTTAGMDPGTILGALNGLRR